jgi:hypothetical protein
MAITIRNKTTEAMIREIGRRRGEGPSAVVRYLAESKLRELQVDSPDRAARRKEAVRVIMASRPKLTEEQKRDIGRKSDELYDERGLPK